MKRRNWMILPVMLLALAIGAPALAQTTRVSVDGKTYTFFGDEATYEADGKTFIIDGDNMRIQESGKADRVVPMETKVDTAVSIGGIIVETGAVSSETSTSISYDTEYFTDSIECKVETMIEQAMESGDYDLSEDYSQYASFGLIYDADENALFYNGHRVRVFEDFYSVGDNAFCVINHFDETGVIDITAKRNLAAIHYNADGSYDPSGTLTGLRVSGNDEFIRRDLTEWTSPVPHTNVAISEGDPMSMEELRAFYAQYEKLGLAYDAQTDRLSYDKQLVRSFLDIRQSNGESLSGGRFKGSMTQMSNDTGDIDVTILRDYDDPDADGNGRIIGIRVEAVK